MDRPGGCFGKKCSRDVFIHVDTCVYILTVLNSCVPSSFAHNNWKPVNMASTLTIVLFSRFVSKKLLSSVIVLTASSASPNPDVLPQCPCRSGLPRK